MPSATTGIFPIIAMFGRPLQTQLELIQDPASQTYETSSEKFTEKRTLQFGSIQLAMTHSGLHVMFMSHWKSYI